MNVDFIEKGWFYIPDIITPEEALTIKYENLQGAIRDLGGLKPHWDPDRGNVLTCYKPAAAKFVMDRLQPILEDLVGEELYQTYWFCTTYFNRGYMACHTDRPSCEISVTLNISSTVPWEIHIKDKTGKHVKYATPTGHGVAYLGCEVPHWRAPLKCGEKEYFMQLFCHFVKKNGEYAEYKDDKKPCENKTITKMQKPKPINFAQPTNEVEDYLKWFSSLNLLPAEHIHYLCRLKYWNNFEPKVIYDIGANCMHWYQHARHCWPEAEYYLIDGTKEFEFLYKSSGEKYSTEILSDIDHKEVTYYENIKNTGGNSYYPLNYDDFPYNIEAFKNEYYKETKRTTRTLDSIVKENGWKKPDLIKMDVQGAELDIIKGAKETIQSCGHIILELQNKEYMKGAPMIDTVVEYMKSIGYEPISNICISTVDQVDGDYHFVRRELLPK